MENGARQGQPEEELFMSPDPNRPRTPTIQPLRITKTGATPSPAPHNATSYGFPTSQSPPRRAPYPDEPSFERQERRPYPMTTPPSQQRQYGATPSTAYNAPPSAPQTSQSPAPLRVQPPQPFYPAPNSGPSSFPHYPAPGDQQPAIRVLRPGERNPIPQKPLPESPGPDLPDKDSIYYDGPRTLDTSHQMFHARDELDDGSSTIGTGTMGTGTIEPSSAATEFARQYYGQPPAAERSNQASGQNLNLAIPQPQGVNRLASSASVNTTRASRGSPPPAETPEGTYSGGNVYPNYPVPGTTSPRPQGRQPAPLALGVAQQYGGSSQQQQQAQWPSQGQAAQNLQNTTYQSPAGVGNARPVTPPRQTTLQYGQQPQNYPGSPIESEMSRLRLGGDEPPPAYASVTPNSGPGYAAEKPARMQQSPGQTHPNLQNHPAFANDPSQRSQQIASPTPSQATNFAASVMPELQQAPSPAPSQMSQTSHTSQHSQQTISIPPPLPEGWIAHLDSNTGHYYYIHLPTQATQWEFPKGPTPQSLNEPLSPTGTFLGSNVATPTASTFNFNKPLGSPGFAPQDIYRQSMLSMSAMSSMSSPTAAGFTQPPPTSGVEQYRIAPTNGVYFGPYLRYTNMDVDNGYWYGSIMLVTDVPHPPTIHIHQSADLSPNPRQLKANPIHQHLRWTFYRYNIDLAMLPHETRWTYAITSHLGCTRYEFLVASRNETSWRFIAHSGNDFALNVSGNERSKLGGVGYMWRDILQKHQDVGGFHVQLGLGNQIYADRVWREVGGLRQWTGISGKEARAKVPWNQQLEEEVAHAYFHYYTSHFDQTPLREAFAQIPHVLTVDDHEIFDGYGSYPPLLSSSPTLRNTSRIALTSYLLFQHHTTPTILSQTPSTNTFDLFTITGTGFHFVKLLGPAVAICAPDTRSERTPQKILSDPTWQGLFPKIAMLAPSVQHCIWMIPVPLIYPRAEAAEAITNTIATGKKAVTGTFNTLSRLSAGVAGLAGSNAKVAVGDTFSSLKKAVGKSGLMSSLLTPFGELEGMDELRDAWTHESKDLERTYFIRTLQGIAQHKSLRMTFLSGGGGGCAAAGLVHDPSMLGGSKSMYQIVTSSVVNAPPNSTFLKFLHPSSFSSSSTNATENGGNGNNSTSASSSKPLYLPPNGQKSAACRSSDTKEDMLDVFAQDVNGSNREGALRRLMGRRNWVSVVAFDAEAVREGFQMLSMGGTTVAGSMNGGGSVVGSATGWAEGSSVHGGSVNGSVNGGGSVRSSFAGPGLPGQVGGDPNGQNYEWQQAAQNGQLNQPHPYASSQAPSQALTQAGSIYGSERPAPGRLSLAFDFMVQSDAPPGGHEGGQHGYGGHGGFGGFGGQQPATLKYGPIVVPPVEYGR